MRERSPQPFSVHFHSRKRRPLSAAPRKTNFLRVPSTARVWAAVRNSLPRSRKQLLKPVLESSHHFLQICHRFTRFPKYAQKSVSKLPDQSVNFLRRKVDIATLSETFYLFKGSFPRVNFHEKSESAIKNYAFYTSWIRKR